MMNKAEDPLLSLIEKTAEGERCAFQKLYELTSAKLFGVLLRILKQQSLAEDVIQEVYLLIWEKAASYKVENGRVMSWMIAIARNKAIDTLRRSDEKMFAVKGSEFEASFVLDEMAQHQQTGQIENRMMLEHCLDEIEETSKESVLLAYHFGFSRDELAKHYDVPTNTIKTRLRRALARLKDCLER